MAAAFAFGAAACTDTVLASPDATSVRLEAMVPERQYAAAGTPIEQPPAVRVLDAVGAVLRGVRVLFRLEGPGGTTDAPAVSDSAGVARVALLIPAVAGTYRVTARVTGSASAARFEAITLPQALATGESARRCPIAPALLTAMAGLDSTGARIRRGDSLRIVALGSSSTVGWSASRAESTFVRQLERMLHEAYPGTPISVVNAGAVGDFVWQMAARIPTDVAPVRPHLVVLQAATNEARLDYEREWTRGQLAGALTDLGRRGYEVLYLDPQRFPGVGESATYTAYVDSLAVTVRRLGVPIASRFAQVRDQLAAGRASWDELVGTDRLHPSDLGHRCTARLLALGVARAAAVAP